MLQYVNNIYLQVVSVQSKKEPIPPTVHLNIHERNNGELKLIGQMRFNFDPSYSKNREELRMSFNSHDISYLDPLGKNLLEDIIVAGFLWVTLDNHYTYDFYPKPYMVIHDYTEDSDKMGTINSAARHILTKLECDKKENNIYVFSKDKTSKYLLDKLAISNKNY